MNASNRQILLQDITRRLVIFTGTILLVLAVFLYGYMKFADNGERSYLVLLVFMTGLLGGFVSIQQRLPKIDLDELKVLSGSWVSVTLIPINGGIFALVLMLMFIGNIIQGQLFPAYPGDFSISDLESFNDWLTKSYPLTGTDAARLLFWSFVAGFSERFVPQVIRRTANDASNGQVSRKPHDPGDRKA